MSPFSARKVNDYDLYAGHAWYVPGVKGMFGLVGWFLLGALLGGIVQGILGLFMPAKAVLDYGMIVVYPVQFLPAMVYAAHQSQRNMLFGTGYALNNRHFQPWNGTLTALVTIILTYATMLVADLPNWWNMQLTMKSPIMARFYDLIMEAMKQMTGGPLWSSFLVVAIFAPVFEEWLCRGMVLRGLLKHMKPVWAIVVSALFFAVIHANPWQALNAFILGVVMGYVYYKTGSLLLTMLIHFLNNGTSVILSNIESLKDYDFWIDMMGGQTYMVAYAVAILALVGGLWFFSHIRLEHPWGNIDEVKAVDDETPSRV
ncbi:MAG: CPBP family intramembrane metalloprotease [Bacteroidales bacterium]|nr:CPBP family intramembrane metalloprotease [Bacteroidales bacterium]